MQATPSFYSALAIATLVLHALFIVWAMFGALLTRSRPLLRWLHIVSLVWGIFTELLPWPCPMAVLENWFEAKAGVQPYQGGFLLHYLDKLVYPDISATVLTACRRLRLRSQSCPLRTADVDRPQSLITTFRSYPAWRNETNSHCPSGVDVCCRRM